MKIYVLCMLLANEKTSDSSIGTQQLSWKKYWMGNTNWNFALSRENVSDVMKITTYKKIYDNYPSCWETPGLVFIWKNNYFLVIL